MKGKLHFGAPVILPERVVRMTDRRTLCQSVHRRTKNGLQFCGFVSKDPLNGTWANSKSVRVFETRQAAAENLP